MKLTPIFLIVAQASPPAVILSLAPIAPLLAQLTPDNTLGAESSVVTPVGATGDRIDGGAARGSNLFHSFSDFNVDASRRVDFANPTGIENIMTRVTGSNPSNILGTLGVLGEANLFLINPNGIIFGPDASLDIRGSFFATTGDSIKLGEQGIFSATNLEGSQLLNVKPEAIFTNAMANHMAQLNSQAGLAVGPGSTLALHGGEVTISGELGGGEVEVWGNNISIGAGGINLAGPDVRWQANNDIKVNSDVTVREGNSLTLQSGRSIEIGENSIINLDGGDFSARVNDDRAVADGREGGASMFEMKQGSQILTNGGNVTVEHGTFGEIAVGEVLIDRGTIDGGTGNISIVGTGNDDGNGIALENGSRLEVDGRGTITLAATSGKGEGENRALQIMGTGSIIRSVDGDIALNGTTSTENDNLGFGIFMAEGGILVEALGSGEITMNGIMRGSGIGGIFLQTGNVIRSASGNITLTGKRSDRENPGQGYIMVRSVVESTTGGAITISGGEGGGIIDVGISIEDGSLVRSVGGDINLRGMGENLWGVRIFNSAVAAIGGGNITIGGFSATGPAIDLEQAVISGTGELVLEPIDPTAEFRLNVEQSILSNPQNAGFDLLRIGDENHSTAIRITGVGLFNAPVLVASDNGAIDTTEATLLGFDDATFTLETNSDINAGNIYNPTGIVTLNSINGTVNTTGTIVDRRNFSEENQPLIPDNSLGAESSVVVADEGRSLILGGRRRGNNLLHSFEQFNILTGGDVSFANPEGISNILSRVTGNEASEIWGRLGVEGDANLFLLNPNGILFAPGSGLNLVGSFTASTGDAVGWDNGEIFSSNRTAPLPTQIFNVNPTALLFNEQTANGTITVQTALQVPEGESLTLVGGNVSLGGKFTMGDELVASVSRLSVPGGLLELGAINNGEWVLGTGASTIGNIQLPNQNIAINAPISTQSFSGDSGDITLHAQGNITTTEGIASYSVERKAGDIWLQAEGNINMETANNNIEINAHGSAGGSITISSGGSIYANAIDPNVIRIENRTSGPEPGGNIALSAEEIILSNEVVVQSATVSSAPTGDVTVNASDEVLVQNSRIATVADYGSGNAGSLTINAPRLRIIQTPSEDGQTGIGTNAGENSSGNGGDLTINASESVELIGNQPEPFTPSVEQLSVSILQGDTGIQVGAFGGGDAGDLTINTGRFLMLDGAGASTAALLGAGGDLTVNAEEISSRGSSGLATTAFGIGDAGNLTINAEQITLWDGAGIVADVLPFPGIPGGGNAGTLRIDTATLSVGNGSRIGASTASVGNGGELRINASESVEVAGRSSDGTVASGIAANSLGTGNAGNVQITTDQLRVIDGGEISTATVFTGRGGDISLFANELSMSNNAQISAATLGTGRPGNIEISEASVVSLDGSAISTAVFPGAMVDTSAADAGGSINIQTGELSLANEADITASTSGAGNAGSVTINASNAVRLSESIADSAVLSGAQGNGGSVTVNAPTVELNSSRVFASTSGRGNAGSVNIDAAQVSLDNSEVSSAVEELGVGTAGSVNIEAGTLLVANNSGISTSTQGVGKAGDVNITVTERVNFNESIAESAVLPGAVGDGGSVTISSQQLTLTNSRLSASTAGRGDGGNVIITAPETVIFDGTSRDGLPSGAFSLVLPDEVGNAGGVSISTGQLSLTEGARINASTLGLGEAGSLEISATQGMTINGFSSTFGLSSGLFAATETGAVGTGGDIIISTPNLEVSDGAVINARTRNEFIGGDIQINGNTLSVTGGGQIFSSGFSSGDAGSISINATEKVTISGSDPTYNERVASFGEEGVDTFGEESAIASQALGDGKAGSLTVNTGELIISDGGIASVSSAGTSDAGDLRVNAGNINVNNGSISATTNAGGQGNINLRASSLMQLENNATITAGTEDGSGGTIIIEDAPSLRISSGSGLFAEATGDGTAGSIEITTSVFAMDGNSQLEVSSRGAGPAGSVNIRADRVSLSNSSMLAETAAGNQGNITIDAPFIVLGDGSGITTNATGSATGGNITIATENLVARDDSDISANAIDGRGGNISITGSGVFLDRESEITATSQRGVDGIVEINSETERASGVVELENNPLDAEKILAQNLCVLAKDSSFIITGRGGIAQNHTDQLQSPLTWQDFRLSAESDRVAVNNNNAVNVNSQEIVPDEIRQAQGWVQLPDGTVVLTSYPVIPTPHGPLLQHPGCNGQ